MMRFEAPTGPDLGAQAPRYPEHVVPGWYRDAKLGFFVHWGIYSVPAWAETKPCAEPEHAYARHRYAEWYANTVRIEGSGARRLHEDRYGVGCTYEDLADRWAPADGAVEALVERIAGTGAQYVVPTTKHHDGFCLWRTATTPFHAGTRGPRRDLIDAFARATRARSMRFGVYFSGAHDWHVADLPPITSDADVFRLRRNDPAFARFAAAQLDELVELFEPDLLWNDIDWPDAGKGRESYGVAALLERYLERVPHGTFNDRWGVPCHGFLTREYLEVDGIPQAPWESTRGLGHSFGCNEAEGVAESLSGRDLVRLLVDVVARGGNLLINVGPRADGSIPDVQAAAMDVLGEWMAAHGDALLGSRPWERVDDRGDWRAVRKDDGVRLLAIDPAAGSVTVPIELAQRRWRWSDGTEVHARGSRLDVPEALRATPVAVARECV